MTSPLITAEELLAREPKPTIVDATWYLDPARSGHRGYLREHIPGARFFDIDAVCDPASPLPHMLPSPEAFAAAVGAMGIGEGDAIVAYDAAGVFSAPRVWWTFRAMGAADVRVLDGGLPAWKAAGGEVAGGGERFAPAVFRSSFDPAAVVSHEEMRALVDEGGALILDARPQGRFEGREAEPRPGLSCGHMPGARNLPLGALVEEGRMRPKEELRKVLTGAGAADGLPVVTSCGSGVAAAVLAFAMELAGLGPARVYDGSWAAWGADKAAPVVTGPA